MTGRNHGGTGERVPKYTKLMFPDAGRKNFTTVQITRYQMEPQLSNTSCNKDIKPLDSDLTRIHRIKNCLFSNPQLHDITFEIQILPLTMFWFRRVLLWVSTENISPCIRWFYAGKMFYVWLGIFTENVNTEDILVGSCVITCHSWLHFPIFS